MRAWAFPVGRIFGVDVRIHAFFVLLLGASIAYATVSASSPARWLGLWLLLLFGVAVRDLVKAVTAAWFGLELRSLLLLPTGGLVTYATPEATDRAESRRLQRILAATSLSASLGSGLVLGASVMVLTPHVDLLAHPWISPAHLVRAAVWINLLLAAVNLLPAWPLDGGRVFRGEFTRLNGGAKGARAAAGLGQLIAIALAAAGVATGNTWLVLMGVFVLIGSHLEKQGVLPQTDVDAVLMRDVMLTEFSTLSASDTLDDALQRSIHTLQDVFPVVRGMNVVGAVSRQIIVESLRADGNGYVQGVMTRSFQTAQQNESLVKALRKIVSERGAQLVPVLEGDRIVGIITPQNLQQSIGMLHQRRKIRGELR